MDGHLGLHLDIVQARRREQLARAARERRAREAAPDWSWRLPDVLAERMDSITAAATAVRPWRSLPVSGKAVTAPRLT